MEKSPLEQRAAVGALNGLQVACANLEPKKSLKRLRDIERQEEASGRWYAPAAPARGNRR